MRALVWTGPRQMMLQDVPTPDPGPGEVLLAVTAVGICGSELSGYLGENSLRRPPLVMGHEFCAVVRRAGPGGRPAVGETVVCNPLLSCGACRPCRTGAENLCLQRRIVGAACPGAFAPLVAVPASACHPAPAGIPPALAALAEPLACAVRAVEQGRPTPGATGLVIGAGAIGLLTLAAARHAGAGPIIVADVHPGRLRTAGEWGAAALLDGRGDVAAESRRLTDGGVDVVFEAVGLQATRRAAVAAARPGGRVVLIGLHDAEAALPVTEMVRAETEVLGSFCYRRSSFTHALDLLGGGLLRPGPWLEERPLEAGPESFAELTAGRVGAAKIVLRP